MTVKRNIALWRSRIDPGFLVVLVICLLAIWPFLSRAALPQATDAELHVFRLAELSRLVRAGEFYPRWAPNFYFGFGYPIFNYYAPLIYYLGLIFDFMPVVGPVTAVKALFILGLVIAGLGMYGFVRGRWGSAAGVIAATSYIYSPYILFIDPHARGDLAEAFSFAWFPLAIWALDRLRCQPSPWNWLASVFTVAAIILTHNLMAMVFFGLLLGWTFWQAIIGNMKLPATVRPGWFTRGFQFRLLFALLIAVGISSFFWLVVALEQGAVNLGSLIGDGGHFDFRNHFVSITELFGPSRIMDWGATQPDYAMNIGPAQWLLGFVGIIAVLIGAVGDRKQAAYFAMVSIGLIFLMLPLSTKIWESIPLLEFLQFPWRLLGAEAAALAIMAGVAGSAIEKKLSRRQASWVVAIIVGAVILSAFPLLEVPRWPTDFGPTSVSRVLSEELSGRWLGTTSTADFVPSTVDIIPKPQASIVQDMQNGQLNDRVNRLTLGVDTTVNSITISPLNTRYFVTSSRDFLLRLFLFDFPGWQVTIDGVRATVELARPEGFIVVPISAGQHVVDVKFGNTPARNLALTISLISLALTVAFTIKLMKHPAGDEWNQPGYDEPNAFKLLPVLIVVVLIFLVSVLAVQPTGLLRYESVGQKVEIAEIQSNVNFGDQINLFGYDLPESPALSGDELTFTAYWKTQEGVDINYQVFVHLMDANDNLVAQSDKLNPGDFPTKRWPSDKYVRDTHQLEVPENLPTGFYKWSIGLWVADNGWRLPVLGESGQQVGDSFIVPEVLEVKRLDN